MTTHTKKNNSFDFNESTKNLCFEHIIVRKRTVVSQCSGKVTHDFIIIPQLKIGNRPDISKDINTFMMAEGLSEVLVFNMGHGVWEKIKIGGYKYR